MLLFRNRAAHYLFFDESDFWLSVRAGAAAPKKGTFGVALFAEKTVDELFNY